MAAPSTTQWGDIKGSGNKQGRIGINVVLNNTSDRTNVTIEIWYWTKFAVSDTSNTFKYGWGTSATTTIGSKSINTSGNSGSGFSTSNQVFIGSYSTSYARSTAAVTKYASASFANVDYGGGSGSKTVSFTIPSKAAYTINFNANGGSGAPSSISMQYNVDVNIPESTPVRSGYKFLGWATSSTASSPNYYHGATYPAFNGNTTLYAVWGASAYTINYNANGGTGAPASQNKSHGASVYISSTIPSRTNYRFEGWGVTPDSTTVAYRANDLYSANASITLYAIWVIDFSKPKIENYIVQRSDSYGNYQTDGTYAKVRFDWSCDSYVQSINIYSKPSGTASYKLERSVYASGYSGTVSEIVGGTLSTTSSYDIKVEVTDSKGTTSYTKPIASKTRLMECRADRNGITFGGVASETGLVSHWDLKLKTGKIHTPSGLQVDGKSLLTAEDLNGYWGINTPSGATGYVRTPQGGILPYQSGGHGKVGNAGWEFSEGHFKTLFVNGKNIANLGSEQKILATLNLHMTAVHDMALSEPISQQQNGIVLVFSYYSYSAGSKDEQMSSFFVPKKQVELFPNKGVTFNLSNHWYNAIKYLYISDTRIKGHDTNAGQPTVGGVKYNNDFYVLRYVIGV